MRKIAVRFFRVCLLIELACGFAFMAAGLPQPVTLVGPGLPSPGGGSGDSLGPVLSADGRYVLFASTANNLVTGTTNPLPVAVPPALNVYLRDRTSGQTTLVSVSAAGAGGGNGDSIPVALSTNGQFALFESRAGNLLPNVTNGFSAIFIRDLVAGQTLLVSASTNGGEANGLSRNAVMTPDGRYVAFTSEASNLVTLDANTVADVFVRDVQAGTTTLASIGATGPASAISDFPEITPDGRYVLFESGATNLVPGVLTSGDIYIRDLVNGITTCVSSPTRTQAQTLLGLRTSMGIGYQNGTISEDGQFVALEAVQPPSAGKRLPGAVFRYNVLTAQIDVVSTNANFSAQSYDDPGEISMTPDGQFIAFVGNTNVSSGDETSILVWSAASGSTALASANLSNAASSNAVCNWPVIDPTGRYVVFQSTATDLTANALTGTFNLFLRDLQAGATTLVNAGADGSGTGLGPNVAASLSTNGQLIAFASFDGNLASNDLNRAYDVFVRDAGAGTNEFISSAATLSVTPVGLSGLNLAATTVSTNARFVAFTSDADDLIPNDTNGWRDVFVRDTLLGSNILVSVATNGGVGNDESFSPSVSLDGRYVAFASSASNLVANDFNKYQDVFVRDMQAGTTVLASVNTSGVSGNADSLAPMMDPNGHFVVFQSAATDLASGTASSGVQRLFLRDLQANATYVLSASTVSSVSMTPDGHYVLFDSEPFYIWDTQSNRLAFTSSVTNGFAVSADGNSVVINQGSTLLVLNRAANTTAQIAITNGSAVVGLNLSADGHWLVLMAAAPYQPGIATPTHNVYLCDLLARTNTIINRSYTSPGVVANGQSDYPAISGDGRFVAYRSSASNLVPGVTNGSRNIYLYDRASGGTTLVTASQLANTAADGHSMPPVFSPDGQTLVFQSWASDLAAEDGNFNSDVFTYALATNSAGQPFFAQIIAGGAPGANATISWTAVPGANYQAQYKNSLTDPVWQNIVGGVTVVGAQGLFVDPSPAASQRFYRIVAF